MTVVNYYYMVGGIVGSCSIIGVVAAIGRSMFYPKIDGFLLENEIRHIHKHLEDIKCMLGNKRHLE